MKRDKIVVGYRMNKSMTEATIEVEYLNLISPKKQEEIEVLLLRIIVLLNDRECEHLIDTSEVAK